MYLSIYDLGDYVWGKYNYLWFEKDIKKLIRYKKIKTYYFGKQKVFKKEEIDKYMVNLEVERLKNKFFEK